MKVRTSCLQLLNPGLVQYNESDLIINSTVVSIRQFSLGLCVGIMAGQKPPDKTLYPYNIHKFDNL